MNICPKFLDLSPERWFLVVNRNNHCINCLTSGNRVCKSTFSFSVCKLNHNSLLHREVSGSSSGMVVLDGPVSSGTVKCNSEVQNCFAATSRQIILGTEIVGIYHRG